jgi:Fibronectin type III domain
VLVLAFLILFSRQSYPASLTLAWDPADNLAEGFQIYYGLESGIYDEVIDVGASTNYTIFGLEPDQAYYIAVTAYNASGESDFSVELAVNPPYNCDADFDGDADVDGADLIFFITFSTGFDLADLSIEYGSTDCI